MSLTSFYRFDVYLNTVQLVDFEKVIMKGRGLSGCLMKKVLRQISPVKNGRKIAFEWLPYEEGIKT